MKNIIDTLHPLEIKILNFLEDNITLNKLAEKTNLKNVQVSRVIQDLEKKNILKIKKEEREYFSLTELGEKAVSGGFPDSKFISVLKSGELTLDEIKKKVNLSQQEISACIGKYKKYLAVKKTDILSIKLILGKEKEAEEEVLKKDNLLRSIKYSNKAEKNRDTEELKKRGLIETKTEKVITVNLTETGKNLKKQNLETNLLETVDKDTITSKIWKKKKFRKYNIDIEVPKISRSKRHFVNQSINKIKRIWLDLGFKEMTGSHVHTAFWDMDALFVPQDHPAREMQDTFYINESGRLPKEFKNKIKSVHENGSDTGSTGWRTKWSEEEASKVLLRTHTTVLSALEISMLNKNDLPKKFFAVGKVYRNESLDWKHLFEFYQVEGIVVDPKANFRNLLGYLKEFYKKLGFEKVRIRPFYFPYTSFSCEVEVFHPGKKEWMELGGAGIFRPEVVKPLLGFECPVLAWGQGMERGIVDYFNIKDLRDLYSNNLKMLREIKEVI